MAVSKKKFFFFHMHLKILFTFLWRIFERSQFSGGSPKVGLFFQLFAKNCMKMKEFGPRGGGGGGEGESAGPLDPPMQFVER